jgi:pSer/pThr/pTyr-binding forkhead associated (FHA) protein
MFDVITEIGSRIRQRSCARRRVQCADGGNRGPFTIRISGPRAEVSGVLVEEAISAPRCAPPAVRAETGFDGFALVVTEGESPGRCIGIGPAPTIIGRGVGVDLQIRDPTVSRHHCVVWCTAGRCWVRDLGSTNLTRVNNRQSLVTEIVEGDVLVVGQTALMLTRNRAGENGPVRS